MNTGVNLNQYQIKNSVKEKNPKNSYKSSENSQSFAEKLKAMKEKKNYSLNSSKAEQYNSEKKSREFSRQNEVNKKNENEKNNSAEATKRDKELKKNKEELIEEILVQFNQYDLSKEENKKLRQILKEAGAEKVQKAVLDNSDTARLTAADNPASILSENNFKKLVDNLSSLLSSNGSEELKKNQKNPVLNLLLKDIERAEIEASKKQLLAEQSQRLSPLKDEDRTELFESELINKLKQNLINQKTPVKKKVENLEAKVKTQTAVNLEEMQLLESEQKSDLKNEFFAEVMKSDAGKSNAEKSNQELKILNYFNKNNSSELSRQKFADLFKGDSAEAKKDSAFKFNGIDSFFNFEFESSGEEINNLNNSSDFKQNISVKDQLVEKFKGDYSAAKNEMNLELKPESLGKIEIKLRLEQGKLAAKMIVDNKIVQSQLENSLQDLKSDLSKQGINIEQFKIETADNSPREVKKQSAFNFNQQEQSFSDGEKGSNSEYQQRKFFKGQYYPKLSDNGVAQDYEPQLFEKNNFLKRGRLDNLSLNFLV